MTGDQKLTLQLIYDDITNLWRDFLIELSQTPTGFFILKMILLALRTCYSLSFVAIAIIFWPKNKVASVSLGSFILVSVTIINIAQLLGMALVPIAHDYVAAVNQGESLRMVSLEVSAQGIYTAQEYLDTFVNTVTFIGAFIRAGNRRKARIILKPVILEGYWRDWVKRLTHIV